MSGEAFELEFPELNVALRSKKGLQFYSGGSQLYPEEEHVFLPSSSNGVYSADGELFAFTLHKTIRIVSSEYMSHDEIRVIERPGVSAIQLSPFGTYLVTWEKLAKAAEKQADSVQESAKENSEDNQDNGEVLEEQDDADREDNSISPNNEGNLIVWEISSGKIVARFYQKKFNPEDWPYIQWSADEHIACRLVSNEVHFFNGRDMSAGIQNKYRQQKIQFFSLSPLMNIKKDSLPKQSYTFLSYVPSSKGAPAKVALVSYPDMSILSSKSFFNSDRIEALWSFNSEYVLVKGITEVGKDTYYGSTKLYLLSRKGESFNVVGESTASRITVADAQWSPTAKEFVVIYGRVATLYSAKDCTPIFEFGSNPWNTVRWNPQGTLLMLGGFGNMAGDFQIWHRKLLKQIGSAKAHGSKMYEWAPDGLRFFTASIFPWRRVENCLKIWSYSGELLQVLNFEELYQVISRKPFDPSEYPAVEFPDSHLKKLTQAVKKKIKGEAKKVFLPPHLRAAEKNAAANSVSSSGAVGRSSIKLHEESKPKILAPEPKSSISVSVGNSNAEKKPRRRPRKKNNAGSDL